MYTNVEVTLQTIIFFQIETNRKFLTFISVTEKGNQWT